MSSQYDVLIIGAGMAGLSCATRLVEHGLSCQILEASDSVGGRVRTDKVDGFRLDRGFQVFPTAYPVCRQVLDFVSLNLHAFYPGALVWSKGRFHLLSDPLRRPWDGIRTCFTPIGTLSDKLRVARLRWGLASGTSHHTTDQAERMTLDALREYGFSREMTQAFFRPFLGGIFLDPELRTSERMFEFVLSMFALGDTALPAAGMGAIPAQLAARLPTGTIRLGAEVTSLDNGGVTLTTGEQIAGKVMVVAADFSHAAQLLPDLPVIASRGVTCLYYAAQQTPISGPYLVLNGEGAGLVNNLCVLSEVAPSYAPHGQSLISVSILGCPAEEEAVIEEAARSELNTWFGPATTEWRFLRSYSIPHAQPTQEPGFDARGQKRARVRPDAYVCGDYRHTATIEGATISGLRAAEEIIKEVRR